MSSKTGQCKTCAHPSRARIEFMLANGVSTTKVSKQFDVSFHSVWRHWRDHVTSERKASLVLAGSTDLKIDLDALKRNESESLLQTLVIERGRLQRIADRCEEVGNHQDGVRASLAIVKILELVAKYLGELKIGHTHITNNFLLSPDWVQLRRVIATALRPHPEAQRAVLEAVRAHEMQSGVEITPARVIELPAPKRNGAA